MRDRFPSPAMLQWRLHPDLPFRPSSSVAFWLGIAVVVSLAQVRHNMQAEERQVWKVAYRLEANEYDRKQFNDPRGLWDLVFTTFSPDGKTIAAGYGNGLVRLYRTADGTIAHTLRGHDKPVVQLQFSEDGERLLTTGRRGEVRLWNASDGSLVTRIHQLPPGALENQKDHPIPYLVSFAELSRDGQAILTVGYPFSVLNLWTPDATGTFSPFDVYGGGHLEDPRAGRFSPDGKTVAAMSHKNVHIIDRAARRMTQETNLARSGVQVGLSYKEVANLEFGAFSPDGRRFCVRTGPQGCTWSTGVMVLDTGAWEPISHWTSPLNAVSFAWSPDSRYIAVTVGRMHDQSPRIIDAESGRIVRELEEPERYTFGFCFHMITVTYSPDGKYVLSGRTTPFQCQYIPPSVRPKYDYIWDVETGKNVARLEGAPKGLRPVYSPDGKHIANWSPQPTVWKLVE